jgi:hypothetical protein
MVPGFFHSVSRNHFGLNQLVVFLDCDDMELVFVEHLVTFSLGAVSVRWVIGRMGMNSLLLNFNVSGDVGACEGTK